MFHVSDLFRIVASRSAESEKFDHVTVNQARIYGYLFKHRNDDTPVRISALARNLDVSAAAASQAIERLVKAGMVSRTQDSADRRAVRLEFTPEAIGLVRKHERMADSLIRELSEDFPKEDFATFCRVLSAIIGKLEEKWEAITAERSHA